MLINGAEVNIFCTITNKIGLKMLRQGTSSGANKIQLLAREQRCLPVSSWVSCLEVTASCSTGTQARPTGFSDGCTSTEKRMPGNAPWTWSHSRFHSAVCRHTSFYCTSEMFQVFYKLKASPFVSNKMTAYFIEILTLLQWSGTIPEISPRCMWPDLITPRLAFGLLHVCCLLAPSPLPG